MKERKLSKRAIEILRYLARSPKQTYAIYYMAPDWPKLRCLRERGLIEPRQVQSSDGHGTEVTAKGHKFLAELNQNENNI